MRARCRGRTTTLTDLEQLERQADEVEAEDDGDLAAGLPPDEPQHQRHRQAPGQQGIGGIDRERHDADEGQAEEEQDGEQAALRLEPGETQQLSQPGKAR
jgi:hypothetical protein